MELETWQAPPGDRIPNNPHFPVLLYHGVDAAADGPDAARALFAEHGWGGSWVAGVFDFHHFHSTSHEALAVVPGLPHREPRLRRLHPAVGPRSDVGALLPVGSRAPTRLRLVRRCHGRHHADRVRARRSWSAATAFTSASGANTSSSASLSTS